MPTKLGKIYYRYFSRIQGGLPVHWHLGASNFGDDINPWLFKTISNQTCHWKNTNGFHLLGAGSIASKSTKKSAIIGSGFLSPEQRSKFEKPFHCFSLRGKLSSELIKLNPQFFGDPVSLINLLLPIVTKSSDLIGYIPHVTRLNSTEVREIAKLDDVKIIDVRRNPIEVVKDIASCGKIASQSLHGLIVADAYQIPSAWVHPSTEMIGQDFKFKDYFTSMTTAKEAILVEEFIGAKGKINYQLAKFDGNKYQYLNGLRDFLADLSHSLPT